MSKNFRTRHSVLAAAVALGVSACGGGGGGSNVKSPPPPANGDPNGGNVIVTNTLVVGSGETITKPVKLFSRAVLDNAGTIGGGLDVAVQSGYADVDVEVRNHDGGNIQGASSAISFGVGGSVYNNGSGSLIRSQGTPVLMGVAPGRVENSNGGAIEGGAAGVLLQGGGRVINTGGSTIRSASGIAVKINYEYANVKNEGGSRITGATTALYLQRGGDVVNGAGSTIEALGSSAGSCTTGSKCSIFVEPDQSRPAAGTDGRLRLSNAGTIIGNVQLAPTVANEVNLWAGGVIHGDLDMGTSLLARLTLSGDAGTVQSYSSAVTGHTTFGEGYLTKDGAGTWILDADFSPRLTSVWNGTLRVGTGGTSGSLGSSDIELRDAQLVFDHSDDVTITGSVIGTGPLVQAGTGTLILTGGVQISEMRIETGGTLQIEATGDGPPVQGNEYILAEHIVNDGTLLFNSASNVSSGNISGTGSVVQDGSNSLILSGSNTYTGGTIVRSGSLVAQGILPGSLTVESGAMLGRFLGITEDPDARGVAGNLVSTGEVVVRGGDAKVGGDFTQSGSGTLSVSLGSKLDVAGKAMIEGGTLNVVGAESGYVANTHTDILAATEGVEGVFAQLTRASGVVFTSTTIHYDTNSVWLDTTGLNVTQAAMGDGIGYTSASMGSAVRVQGAFEQLNDRIATDSLGGVPADFLEAAGQFQSAPSIGAAQASLRSLSGELHAASAAMTFRAIDAGNQVLSDRFDAIRDGHAAFGMWTQQIGSGGGMARSGFDGIGFRMDGWLVGNDFRVGHSGVAGFAFGQGQGLQQRREGFDRDANRRTEGMVYAGLASDRWYALGRLGFGHFRQDVNRALLLGEGAEGVWTRYGGRYQVAYGEGGLQSGWRSVRITPFASLQYARSTRDAFAEQGAGGFGLRSDAQSQERWQAALGIRAARQWSWSGGRTLTVGTHAQWFSVAGAGGDATEASFVGLQHSSPLLGIGLSRYGTLFGIGLEARLSPNAMLKVAYDHERGQFDSAEGMTAGFSLAF